MSEVTAFEKCGYLNALNSCLRTQFGTQRVKVHKTLRKPARQHFYAVFHFISNKLSYL